MNDIIIITRDCHGYQYYSGEYNSPTIGNCMYIPDFINFIKNIDIISHIPLQFDDNINKKYPVGILKIPELNDVIRIHFMHDLDKKDILSKWNRRILRMTQDTSFEKYIFLNDCDFNQINGNLDFYLESFFNLSYGIKVLFCKKSTYDKILLDNKILNNGLIVIIPESCKTGNDIYNYVDNNSHIKNHIFTNKNGVLYFSESN